MVSVKIQIRLFVYVCVRQVESRISEKIIFNLEEAISLLSDEQNKQCDLLLIFTLNIEVNDI